MSKLKKCSRCKKLLPLNSFGKNAARYDGLNNYCRICNYKRNKDYYRENKDIINKRESERRYKNGTRRPLSQAKNSPGWLGVYIAEPLLKAYFENAVRTPMGTKYYDYMCSRGYKINVKSSVIHKHGNGKRWQFGIHRNLVADYFLCIAFDNRDDLNPIKVWLFPQCEIGYCETKSITVGREHIHRKFEIDISKAKKMCSMRASG